MSTPNKITLSAVILKRQALGEALGGYVVQVEAMDEKGKKLEVRSSVGCGNRLALAQRLKKAIDAGKAATNPVLRKDINGKEYVGFTWQVLGRHLNADLRRLGF